MYSKDAFFAQNSLIQGVNISDLPGSSRVSTPEQVLPEVVGAGVEVEVGVGGGEGR